MGLDDSYRIQRPTVTQSVVEGFGIRGAPTFELLGTVIPVAIVGSSPEDSHLGTVIVVDESNGEPLGTTVNPMVVQLAAGIGTSDNPLVVRSEGQPTIEFPMVSFEATITVPAFNGAGQTIRTLLPVGPFPDGFLYRPKTVLMFGEAVPSQSLTNRVVPFQVTGVLFRGPAASPDDEMVGTIAASAASATVAAGSTLASILSTSQGFLRRAGNYQWAGSWDLPRTLFSPSLYYAVDLLLLRNVSQQQPAVDLTFRLLAEQSAIPI